MIYKIQFSLLILFAACLLSSCYTNHNQRWLEKHRVYEGYELYGRRLPESLYRCGDDWYIAGIRGEYKDVWRSDVYFAEEGYAVRHSFKRMTPADQPPLQICYHRITPELAAQLLARKGNFINSSQLKRDFRRAGGGWLCRLPSGAQAVPGDGWRMVRDSFSRGKEVTARGLKERRVTSSYIEKVAYNSAPWYNYPAVALSFVVEDIPLSVCYSVMRVGFYPFNAILGYYFMRSK